MKKYILIALAAAGTMACSKLTPVDSIPVTELPEDETTETVAPKEGETITIQLAQTKVTLNGTDYVFEGNEQIVVKAASGPVATISNSTEYPTTFTGVFETPLDKESDIFDFYYNCPPDASGNPSYVQNGQPWLEHKAVPATRATNGEYAYVVEEDVQLRQPEAYVALALISPYDCTVDFHSISAKIPYVSGKALPGITLTKTNQSDDYTKPYFVNVTKNMEGGFYLAVQQNGTEGTMYTSYATSAAITKNNQVLVKKFTPFSITGELKATYKDANNADKEYFKSSYSVYIESGATAANAINPDVLQEGKAEFTITGISKKLVSLQSLTVTFDDTVTATVGSTTPIWSDNSTCTIAIPESSGHNNWGPVTVTGATAVFSIPDGTTFSVKIDIPTTITRYITGLPYNKDNAYITNFASDWVPSGGKSEYRGNYLRYANCTVSFKGFFIPTDIKTVVSYYISGYVSSRANPITTVFNIAGDDAINDKKQGTAKEFSYQTTRNVTFTKTKNTMYAKADCKTPATWAQSYDELRYVGVVYDSAQ